MEEAIVQIIPSGKTLGATIEGLDLSQPLSESDVDQVVATLGRYGVVRFPKQTLTAAQQRAFSARFGELEINVAGSFQEPGLPEVMILSNIVENGKPIGLVDAGALWHCDGSYLPNPDLYTVLYALEIPQRDGQTLGDTLFLSTCAAYDALPDSLRKALDDAEAVHSLTHHIQKKLDNNFKAPPVKDPKPDVVHPAVRVHPNSGRRCLYLTEGHTKELVGFSAEQSAAILKQVAEHVKQPQFVYRHRWQEGDLLIWDNCSTQHLAITDYGTLRRRLHRAGIESGALA